MRIQELDAEETRFSPTTLLVNCWWEAHCHAALQFAPVVSTSGPLVFFRGFLDMCYLHPDQLICKILLHQKLYVRT